MKRVLIHRSVKINSPAAATQISMLAWLAVHVNCHYQPDSCSHGWFCFRALSMIKTKSSLQLPWKYRFRYPPGWWSIFHINQTNPKTIFLVRLRCSNRKLTRKLFHNRQTKLSGYSTSGRIKPSCYSSLLFRRLFHSALNLNVATQRMGNGNTVLHTIPQQPQNNYSLVRFRCLNVKMTREFGWCGITRWQESYSTSPISPSYLVVWFVLFVINQCHRHIWLFSVLPKEVDILVQVHWQQCWPLMCFNLLKVVVASDSGKYQHQRLLIPSLLF